MDEATIISTTVSTLATYFTAVRDKTLDTVASATVERLVGVVKGIFTFEPKASTALKVLEASPADANALETIRINLETLVRENPALLQELHALVPASLTSSPQTIKNNNSPNSVTIQTQGNSTIKLNR